MEAILTGILSEVLPVLGGLVGTLASLGLLYVNRWLKARIGSEAVTAICTAVGSTVSELNATIVKEMKKAASDGKLTQEEAERIKMIALQMVKQQVPNTVVKAARASIADLDSFIRGKIEQEVKEQKNMEGVYIPGRISE